jgi:ketosteroid isomerase-like protein
MPEKNRAILEEANAAIVRGDTEGFLAFCSEDTEWTFVGDQTLRGKEGRSPMDGDGSQEPPQFTVTEMITEGDFVVAAGSIVIKDEEGKQ